MRTAVNIDDLRRAARRRLPRMVNDFLEGGAEDEFTLRENRRGFSDIALRPRILVDVSQRDQSTTVCGQRLETPVVLAPTGLTRLASPVGEVGAARAANRAGSVLMLSSASSSTIEDIAAQVTGPMWFQLYPWRDREVVGRLMDRARAAGCGLIAVTVDSATIGGRERDTRNGFAVPLRPTLRSALDTSRHLRWLYDIWRGPDVNFANLASLAPEKNQGVQSLAKYTADLNNPANDWSDFDWLREQWDGALMIKGIMDPADAVLAVEHGADGVIVSNHGGRQVDAVAGSIDILPEVVDAVAGRIDVMVDGGIRRGTDVVKAIAIGAKAVMVGRPTWYALAAGGEAGVDRMLEIFRDEIDRALALTGHPVLSELDRSAVRHRRSAGWE
jgi:isopentenyl diphosphate isomerase/L-lactate dehydrogenase-like FMN-dependent dehydrogenase